MPQEIGTDLFSAISVVCPIDGVSIGDIADRSTWRIDFKPTSTAPQRQAARQLLQSFVISAQPLIVTARDFRQLFTTTELMAVTAAAQTNTALRVFLDDQNAANETRLDSPRVTAVVSAMVTAGLLTQDRATLILAGQPPS